MFERTKDICDDFGAKGIPGSDIAVYQNGICVFRYFSGYSDAEKKIPMSG